MFSMSCSRKQNVLLNRHGGEERFEGWWGPANSSLGARINAIILFQECELKMLELLDVQQKALRGFSSFLIRLKTGGSGEFQAGGWRRSIPGQDKAATKPQSSSAAQSTVTGSALFGPQGAGR